MFPNCSDLSIGLLQLVHFSSISSFLNISIPTNQIILIFKIENLPRIGSSILLDFRLMKAKGCHT